MKDCIKVNGSVSIKQVIDTQNPQNCRQNGVRCHRRRSNLNTKQRKNSMVWRTKKSEKKEVIQRSNDSKTKSSQNNNASSKKNQSEPNLNDSGSRNDRSATMERESEPSDLSLSDRCNGESIEFSVSFFECAVCRSIDVEGNELSLSDFRLKYRKTDSH